MKGVTFQLSPSAKEDLENIIDYTIGKFGLKQAKKYVRSLEKCAGNLSKDYLSRSIPDVDPIISFIKCEHHYIFGFQQKKDPFYIVAIFHEKMDLMERLKGRLK